MRFWILFMFLPLWVGCGSAPEPAEAPSATPAVASDQVKLSPEVEQQIGIKSVAVQTGAMHPTLRMEGRVAAPEDAVAMVVSPVSGRILGLHRQSGDRVQAGDVLATVQSPELGRLKGEMQAAQAKVVAAQRSYDRKSRMAELGVFSEEHYEEARGSLINAEEAIRVAESRLALSQASLARQKPLAADGIISKQDLDALRSQVEVDRAALEKARSQMAVAREHVGREDKVIQADHWSRREVEDALGTLEEARAEMEGLQAAWSAAAADSSLSSTVTIVAPSAGWVLERSAVVGDWADPKEPLFKVADLSRVWVLADARDSDLPLLQRGESARITSRALKAALTGHVATVGQEIDSRRRSLPVRIEVVNRQGWLRPGMTVEAVLNLPERRGILVPQDALVKLGEKEFVFVSTGGAYHRRPVAIATRDGKQALVADGLSAGDLVVVNGQQQLQAETVRGSLGEAQE